MEQYRRAQDGFDAVVAAVPADRWDAPSACPEWTVRDVAGHIVWGQYQIHAWATGGADPEPTGAPGSPHPGKLADGDPVAAWRAARAASVIPEAALSRTTVLPGLGEVTIAGVMALLVTDLVAHTWDIGYPLGLPVDIEPALVAAAFDWARAHMVRAPGFFGPELTPPDGADEQTRMLAYLGRSAWRPVSR